MEEYERVRERIAKWLWCQEAGYAWGDDVVDDYETDLAKKTYRRKADQILALDGIEIRADDQTIIIPCYEDGDTEKCTYINAEPPNWIKDAGLIRVIPKRKEEYGS